jgi:hypothetical protein
MTPFKSFASASFPMIVFILSPISAYNRYNRKEKSTLSGEWRGELINKRKNGEEFPVYLSTSTIRNNLGDIVALLGVDKKVIIIMIMTIIVIIILFFHLIQIIKYLSWLDF